MAAIGGAHRAPDAESPLGKIKAVPHRSAHAIIGHPFDELGINASLQNKIFQKSADLIVNKSRTESSLEAEAPPQRASHVIFTASLPDFEMTRSTHAPLARIKTE